MEGQTKENEDEWAVERARRLGIIQDAKVCPLMSGLQFKPEDNEAYEMLMDCIGKRCQLWIEPLMPGGYRGCGLIAPEDAKGV